MSTNATVLLGRILLSLVFIVTGFAKLTDLGGTTAYFAMLQLKPGCRAVTTDVCVPISRLAECVVQYGLISPHEID